MFKLLIMFTFIWSNYCHSDEAGKSGLDVTEHETLLLNPNVEEENILSLSQDTLTLEKRAELLKEIFEKHTKAASSERKRLLEEAFFEVFPSDFETLVALYGRDEEKGQGDFLYSDAVDHIMGLYNNINSIDDSVYSHKLIKIAMGGDWDADAVSYFQHGLAIKVKENPVLFIELLKSYPKKEQKSFWHFFFDGPHPQEDVPVELELIKVIDSESFNIIQEALNDVQEEWKEH
ncbi:MAG: hypothetical protein WC967_14255 [Balneolaceae bacterium]